MRRETKKAVQVAGSLSRTAKLLRVLVMGGAVLAGSCVSVSKEKDKGGSKSDGSSSSGSDRSGKAAPESGGGVQGW